VTRAAAGAVSTADGGSGTRAIGVEALRRWAVALLVGLALVAHGLGLRNGFVYDDHRFVLENAALVQASPARLALDPAAQTTDADRDIWRPLRTLGHALDARLWGQDPVQSAFGFHLHSLLAHVACVLLGYAALRRLLPPPAEIPALFGAAVLAVHPLGVEVVAWVTSRGDLYAMGLACAALWLYAASGAPEAGGAARGRRVMIVGAGLLAAAATLGKESAVWVPLVALCHHRLLRRGSRAGVVALALGVGAALAARQWAMSGASPVQSVPHGGGPFAQAGWALFGTGRTLLALLWPTGLSVDYGQDAWATWGRLARGLTALPALLAVGLAVALRRRQPVASLLIAWMLLAWLPSSSLLVTLRSLVNDRGAYPLLLPAGALLGLPLARSPRAGLALAALALLLVPASVSRTEVFHDDASLWIDVLRRNPGSVRAHFGLAAVAHATDPDREEQELFAAVGVADPDSRLAGTALALLGDFRLHVRDDPAGAAPLLERALEVQRRWRERGRPDARELATAASLAEALTGLGRDAEADAVLDRALADAPGQVMLWLKQATLLLFRAERDGDAATLQRASDAWRRAAELDPEHPFVRALGQRLSAPAPSPAKGR